MPPANPAVCTTLQRGVTFNYLLTRLVPEDKHFPEGRPAALRNALPTKAQPQHEGGGPSRPLVLTPGWAVDHSGSRRGSSHPPQKPRIVANDFLALALLLETR